MKLTNSTCRGYEGNRHFGDSLIPLVKEIVAKQLAKVATPIHVVHEGPPQEDITRNTDLMFFQHSSFRVAMRLRDPHHWKYRHEFTIRSKTKFNCETEIHKIIAGWGDYFFYGFKNQTNDGFLGYGIYDLSKFRSFWSGYLIGNKGQHPGQFTPNRDGTGFLSFRWRELPSNCIVYQHNLN